MQSAYTQTKAFSNRLQEALGLGLKDMKDMGAGGIVYPATDKYSIISENRYHPGGWVQLLEVTTSDQSLGWSNRPVPEFGEDGWVYIPKGTATVVLPPKGVQDIIISAIKS